MTHESKVSLETLKVCRVLVEEAQGGAAHCRDYAASTKEREQWAERFRWHGTRLAELDAEIAAKEPDECDACGREVPLRDLTPQGASGSAALCPECANEPLQALREAVKRAGDGIRLAGDKARDVEVRFQLSTAANMLREETGPYMGEGEK